MSKFRKLLVPYTLIFLPVVIYLIYAFLNAGSLFYADDFHLLKTVVWMQDVDSPVEKFKLLIQQHNEHRIIIPRLLTWLDYQIEGAINWRTLIMLGNLLWVSVLWFFWKGFKSLNAPVWTFIPVPWILMQPQYYDNVTWSISILQQSVIIFWFGLFCYLCSKKLFSKALLVAIIATFTHGNGIFSFLIGIIFLAFDRNWKGMFRWILVLVVVAVIYFWGFEKGQNANFQKSLEDPLRLFTAFFAFFGSVTKVQMLSFYYAAICGICFVALLAIYLLPRIISFFTVNRPFTFFERLILGNVIFLGITAALVCVSRSWSGVDNVLAPRYQHYSPFVACWVYLVLISLTQVNLRKWLAVICIAGAVLFNGLCYFVYNEDVALRKNWLMADAHNWANHSVFLNYAAPFNRNIREPYSSALNRGICKPDISGFKIDVSGAATDSSVALTFSKNIFEERDADAVYPREYLRIDNKEVAGISFLYLERADRIGYWLPTRLANTGIRRLISTQTVYQPGFSIEFMTENLPEGKYRIGLLNSNRFVWTGKSADISRLK